VLYLILIAHGNAATFSDDNWISMNPSITGADCDVVAAVVDGSGNLYIGGCFAVVGNVVANCIAKWNGSSWSALGSGINRYVVYALAVSGSDVYAGTHVSRSRTAGGSAAVAKWNGSSWSALGSVMGGLFAPGVSALAVSGSDLYAGGFFTLAGGVIVGNIMRNLADSVTMSGNHLFLSGNTDTVVSGNSTKFDATTGTTPVNAVGGGANTSVIMMGNAWRGHSGSTAINAGVTGLTTTGNLT